MKPRVAIVGLGLIGGSWARALRQADAVASLSGFDPVEPQAQAAVRLGVVDRVFASASQAVADADVVMLSVPVLQTAAALRDCLPALKPGAVVTDVGSTKQSVLADVAAVCGAVPPWFVAAHPIAGTEKSGVQFASADLFKGHRVILTPHAGQDADAGRTIAGLWQSAGARVVHMDAARHDAIFAATSHLPHLLAYSFVDLLARLDTHGDIFPNAGGGFRDFTRIASSSPDMWHDIVRANRVSVSKLLEQQIEELKEILGMMKAERWDDIKQLFARARSARERYLTQIE